MASLFDKLASFPKAAPYIIGTETAERFSFYGMKAILTTFLIAQFFNPSNDMGLSKEAEAHANEVTHFFVAMVYLCSILGGLLADYVLGRYWTIIILSVVYCIGHAFLAIFESNYELFYMGLMLIAVGAGGVKPNVSVMVGDQFENDSDQNISKLYDIFYFGINLGAFFSMLITPLLKKHASPAVAFGVPGILMAIALVVFIAGTKKYKIKKPSDTKKEMNGVSIFTQLKSVWKVLVVFCFIPVFWALYDQNGSEWVIQAQHKNMNLTFLGVTWLPEQIQTINALFILVLIPTFTFGIYPFLQNNGIKTTALRKFGWGLALTALTFAFSAWIQHQLDSGIRLNIGWQLFAYLMITVAEILVSITGLEYSFSKAPASMKSTIMSIFFFTVFLGNMLVVLINQSIQQKGFFSQFQGTDYFLLFAGIMLINTILYLAAVNVFNIEDTDASLNIKDDLR
jgi:POT family proton-dependent oligopeptide transporter